MGGGSGAFGRGVLLEIDVAFIGGEVFGLFASIGGTGEMLPAASFQEIPGLLLILSSLFICLLLIEGGFELLSEHLLEIFVDDLYWSLVELSCEVLLGRKVFSELFGLVFGGFIIGVAIL